MFVNGVKVTLIICLTIVVSCVLFISYTEYLNRYSVITASDNSVYIFDRKNIALNKCDDNGCKVLETKLPGGNIISSKVIEGNSTLFGNDKPTMAEEVTNNKVMATNNPSSVGEKTSASDNNMDSEKKEDSKKSGENDKKIVEAPKIVQAKEVNRDEKKEETTEPEQKKDGGSDTKSSDSTDAPKEIPEKKS